MGQTADHPPRPVLGPPGPPAAAGPPGHAHRGGHLRQGLRHPGRVRRSPARLAVDPLLRGQLALHRQRGQLLQPHRPTVTPGPHVVALHRGAVLHRVATGGLAHVAPWAPAAPFSPTVAAVGHGRGRGRRLGPRHAAVLPARRLGHAALRGDRHPFPGHPGGSGPGRRHVPLGRAPHGGSGRGEPDGSSGSSGPIRLPAPPASNPRSLTDETIVDGGVRASSPSWPGRSARRRSGSSSRCSAGVPWAVPSCCGPS